MNLDDYRSQNVGIVFQSYNLLPHLTALENIILSCFFETLRCDVSIISSDPRASSGLNALAPSSGDSPTPPARGKERG